MNTIVIATDTTRTTATLATIPIIKYVWLLFCDDIDDDAGACEQLALVPEHRNLFPPYLLHKLRC
jgi:hypothetical protein